MRYILSKEKLQEDINTLEELKLEYELHEAQAWKVKDIETAKTPGSLVNEGIFPALVYLGKLLLEQQRAETDSLYGGPWSKSV